LVTLQRCPVTAEVASSSLVVPAILFITDRQARNLPILLQYGFGARFNLQLALRQAIMAKIVHFGLTAAAAFIFATSGGNVLANNASADDIPESNATAGTTKAELITLEKSAYEAWKSRDEKFWGYISFR
jgi:hypothetical protein